MSKHTINERENALRALTRKGTPEWIPLGADCIQGFVPSILGERPPRPTDGADWFGCQWVWDEKCMGYAPNLHQPPLLKDVTEWREVVKFPDLDALDWEGAARRELPDLHRENKVISFIMETGPFERSHSLMGFENACYAMYDNPEEYKALIDAVADYKVKLIDKICQYFKPDAILAQDDLGDAKGPMLSLELYRELIKPAHTRISEAIRSHGVIHIHHSCGKMEAFIDDLLETGVQVLNPLQTINDLKTIAAKYGDRVSFDIGAERIANYNDAKEEDMREEVRFIIDTCGPCKNLIIECFPSNSACLENIEVVCDETRRYGGNFYSK